MRHLNQSDAGLDCRIQVGKCKYHYRHINGRESQLDGRHKNISHGRGNRFSPCRVRTPSLFNTRAIVRVQLSKPAARNISTSYRLSYLLYSI